jgi:hypothetical protein
MDENYEFIRDYYREIGVGRPLCHPHNFFHECRADTSGVHPRRE